jgi:hypothetical protein
MRIEVQRGAAGKATSDGAKKTSSIAFLFLPVKNVSFFSFFLSPLALSHSFFLRFRLTCAVHDDGFYRLAVLLLFRSGLSRSNEEVEMPKDVD